LFSRKGNRPEKAGFLTRMRRQQSQVTETRWYVFFIVGGGLGPEPLGLREEGWGLDSCVLKKKTDPLKSTTF
jgi:hypothetical protein